MMRHTVVPVEKTLAGDLKMLHKLLVDISENKMVHQEFHRIGKDYDFETEVKTFKAPFQQVAEEFWTVYRSGKMLPRGRLFSPYYPYLMYPTTTLFKVFYYAPISELTNIISWAMINVNEYQFAYALSVALVHRADTKFMPVPPPWQFHPEFFFNSEFMKQMYDYKIGVSNIAMLNEITTHTIVANYTNSYVAGTVDQEYKLTYFMEDLGLNTWYYFFNQRFPYWMSSKEYPHLLSGERGEMYLFIHKWILNRYQMERMSNDMDMIDHFDWEKPIPVGYSPSMIFPNGILFPKRQEWSMVPSSKNEYLGELREFESRIAAAIDSGFVSTKDGKFESIRTKQGLNLIANLVQGNSDSLNTDFYGSIDHLGRHVVGFSPESHNHEQIVPSALELTPTSLRDPAFYRLYQKINNYYLRYKKHLGFYTREEIAFEGVKVNSVDIVQKKLLTYFEWFDTMVSKFWFSKYTHSTEIKARQYRLNHEPFTYKLNIQSDKDVKVTVRIFLGPKVDIHGTKISENYKYFFNIDYFVMDLKKGTNVFERESIDNQWTAPEHKFTGTFETAETDAQKSAFAVSRYGFPAHMLFPKGKAEGMPVQFFVHVEKFVSNPNAAVNEYYTNPDGRPFGFPLDRPIHNIMDVPNIYVFDTKIYHKEEGFVNRTDQ